MPIQKVELKLTILMDALTPQAAQAAICAADLRSVACEIDDGEWIGGSVIANASTVPAAEVEAELLALGNDGSFFSPEQIGIDDAANQAAPPPPKADPICRSQDPAATGQPIGAMTPDGERLDQWDERLRAAGCTPVHAADASPSRSYVSPTGSPIIGTSELLFGCAIVAGISRTGEPNYEGTTKIWWDDQRSKTTTDGKILFVDDDGAEWTFDDLTPED